MFHQARLKLTAFYLLTIMLISLMFSGAIYQVLTSEITRFERTQRFRIERRLLEEHFFNPPYIPLASQELIEETRRRILFMLLFVNGGILAVSGALGYLLAGRTLRPIQGMVDEQNQFISDASHELRTPLTAMKSDMEVHLRDKQVTLDQMKELQTRNIEDVNKLQLLSDALLTLAQYQKPVSGFGTFETFHVADIVARAVHRVKPMANKKQQKVVVSCQQVSVRGIPASIEDALVILLDNAIKYSPQQSEIAIHGAPSDGLIRISVADHGIGIDPKDLPHIFDRFYRGDTARLHTERGGYGLGLSIAKKIADVHGGSISVKSKKTKGSVFTFFLPRKK